MTFKSNLKKKIFIRLFFCFHFRQHVTQSHPLEVSIAFVDSNVSYACLYVVTDCFDHLFQ